MMHTQVTFDVQAFGKASQLCDSGGVQPATPFFVHASIDGSHAPPSFGAQRPVGTTLQSSVSRQSPASLQGVPKSPLSAGPVSVARAASSLEAPLSLDVEVDPHATNIVAAQTSVITSRLSRLILSRLTCIATSLSLGGDAHAW
jgi:hypothetical protein